MREGERVDGGDVLVELDRRRASAGLDRARASRDLAAARLAELLRGTRREAVDEARARLAETEADLAARELDLERARQLVADAVEPESVLDDAVAAQRAAEARLAANRASLERAMNGATVEELDQARAELARAKAEIAALEIDVERLVIKAPGPGVVDALPFKVGDEPPAGAAVAVLLTGEAPFARVYLPTELRPAAAAGAPATVTVEGYTEAFQGRVRMISSEAAFTPYRALTERDRGHLTYLAEVDLVGEAAAELPTGLPVEVSF